jgi:hypothetical protein
MICSLASVLAAGAADRHILPRFNILALTLTLDLLILISLVAVAAAAVCITLKMYKNNHKLHK